MNTIYAAVQYRERYARRTPIIGRKYRYLELIGISLVCEDRSFCAYNLNYRGQDHPVPVPDTNDPRWMVYADILNGVRNFIHAGNAMEIVIDSNPDEAALIKQLLQESATNRHVIYQTIQQRLWDSCAWLPDTIYGSDSDFMSYYPRHENGEPFPLHQRMDMFLSHHDYATINLRQNNPFLDAASEIRRDQDQAIVSIVEREMQYLQNIKETDISNRVAEELYKLDVITKPATE